MKNRVLAAIQARMGSTRLPGKVLMHIGDHPMIWHMHNRLKASKGIDEIVVATTTNDLDKSIISFCQNNNIQYYAGSENDIVTRMYETAVKFQADALVRVTADCPLIDPGVIDRVIEKFNENDLDFASNWSLTRRTFPDGLDTEIYSFTCLKQLWEKVENPFWREWMPSYVLENPSLFRIGFVENVNDFSDMRWTVDYAEDLQFVREVCKYLYREDYVFVMSDIVELLQKHPELSQINASRKDKAKGSEGYFKAKQTILTNEQPREK